MKPDLHNAAHVTDDGYTLGWDLFPGQDNRIMMEAAAPNLRNIALTAAGTLLLLITALILWKKKRSAEI
ncbi:MAG: LPXTG cell wall anchor domain-containing protein [Firmicutes bacterium]|nr:LPXTG cell wall anchor domain-containing protein [Bacillota bacterium]